MATGQDLVALKAHLAKESACKERLSTLDAVEAIFTRSVTFFVDNSCFCSVTKPELELD